MATAPIDRDTQIKLMKSHADRRLATLKKVVADPKIRDVLKKNLQCEQSIFMRHDGRIAKFG